MSPPTPRSVRFDRDVDDRLRRYVGSRPGLTTSAAVNRFLDEGLRMMEHPAIHFRNGPTGRRAVLVGGPDVWEVIRAVQDARAAEPDLSADEIVRLVVDNTGTRVTSVRAALRYWSQYPTEVDDRIQAAEDEERRLYEAWQREQGLLSA